jgi:hypothetical protein
VKPGVVRRIYQAEFRRCSAYGKAYRGIYKPGKKSIRRIEQAWKNCYAILSNAMIRASEAADIAV